MSRISRKSRRCFTLCLMAALMLFGSTAETLADKLVVFKNGKTMRAKNVKDEKGWSRLEMDGGVMGVRSAQILRIEEASGSAPNAAAPIPNQATTGGGGTGNYQPSFTPPQDQQEDVQQPPDEGRTTPPNAGTQVTPGTRPVVGGASRGLRRFGAGPTNVGQPASRTGVGPGRPSGNIRSQNLGQDDDE